MKLLIIDCRNDEITIPQAQRKLASGGIEQSAFGLLSQTMMPLGWKVIFLTAIDKLTAVISHYGHLFLTARGSGHVYSWMSQKERLFNGQYLYNEDNYYASPASNTGFGMRPKITFTPSIKMPPTCQYFCGGDKTLDELALAKIAYFYPEPHRIETICLAKLTVENLNTILTPACMPSPPRPRLNPRPFQPTMPQVNETTFGIPISPPPSYGAINMAGSINDDLPEKEPMPFQCGCCPPVSGCMVM